MIKIGFINVSNHIPQELIEIIKQKKEQELPKDSLLVDIINVSRGEIIYFPTCHSLYLMYTEYFGEFSNKSVENPIPITRIEATINRQRPEKKKYKFNMWGYDLTIEKEDKPFNETEVNETKIIIIDDNLLFNNDNSFIERIQRYDVYLGFRGFTSYNRKNYSRKLK